MRLLLSTFCLGLAAGDLFPELGRLVYLGSQCEQDRHLLVRFTEIIGLGESALAKLQCALDRCRIRGNRRISPEILISQSTHHCNRPSDIEARFL